MKTKNVSLIGLYYQGKDDGILRALNLYRSMKSISADLKKNLPNIVSGEVEASFDLNEQDRFGRSILNLAIDSHNEKLAMALWRAGADEMKKDGNGEIPLLQAIRKHHDELVLAIVAAMVAEGRGKTDLNSYENDKEGERYPAFDVAVAVSDLKIVEAMLKAGANPLAQDYFGLTPLYTAAEKGFEDKVELMLKFIPENLPEKKFRGLMEDAYYAAEPYSISKGGNHRICRMIDKKRKAIWPNGHWN